jgi:hypothetical protein
VLQEITLLERPDLPVFGDVHALRNENSQLIFLMRTHTSWGISSPSAGPFDDASFGKIMASIDKLLVFLHHTSVPSEEGSAADNAGSGIELVSMKATKGGGGREGRLWSEDVASKWALRKNVFPDETAQTILRTCNLQVVLVQAVNLNANIALSISDATEPEESARRLTLVKRALLQLALSFVKRNANNQECLFSVISELQELATPLELKALEGMGSLAAPAVVSRLALRQASKARGGENVEQWWPFSDIEYGQAIIGELFRRNEDLCDRLPAEIPKLFASIAEIAEDLTKDSLAQKCDCFFS